MRAGIFILLAAAALAWDGCGPWKTAAAERPGHLPASQPDTQPDAAAPAAAAAALTQPDPPPVVARPARVKIAEADGLLLDALNVYKQFRAAGLYDAARSRAVLEKFLRVIREYPQSDKTDEAYYFAGEILKEFLDNDPLAIQFYARAYQINPQTPHPAHFQRAVILDYRLRRRSEALEEYANVLKFEADRGTSWSRSNADYARARIRQLTGNSGN